MEKTRIWASDYNTLEKLSYLRGRFFLPYSKNVTGLIHENRVGHLRSNIGLQNYKIVFVGDIMPANGKSIKVNPALLKLLKSATLIVVNLEGIISTKKRPLALSHDYKIVDFLNSISENSSILVNVANNHAGDFGAKAFYDSIDILINEGFSIIGSKESPRHETDFFNFYSSSYWSNQKFYDISRFNYNSEVMINDNIVPNKFNVFLPHWGYEMQLYPTKEQHDFVRKLQKWNLIIGTHSHCPQPIEILCSNAHSQIICYSLGNFCYQHYNSNHYHGSIFSIETLTDKNDTTLNYQYFYTKMKQTKNAIEVNFSDKLEYKKMRIDTIKGYLTSMR